jgi:L-fuconolactonase
MSLELEGFPAHRKNRRIMMHLPSSTINRRRFVALGTQTALTAAAAGLLSQTARAAEHPASSAQAAKPDFPIIDTHQHLWDLGKVRMSWLTPGGPLTRNFVMKDYREAAAGTGIVRAVYMEVAVDVGSQMAEVDYVLDICRRGGSPTVAAVIGGFPGSDSFKAYITRLKGNPFIKGVRQAPHTLASGQLPFRQKHFLENIRLLGELAMRFDLCLPPSALPDAAQLVDRCPDTQFILDHCGNADPKWYCGPGKDEPVDAVAARRRAAEQWRRDIAALAERKNVVCKISGIVSQAPKDSWTPDDLAPIINHCLEVFGPDRVMFAGDWPVCTTVARLGQWVRALRQVVRRRSVEEQRKLFCDNAVRVYGLPHEFLRCAQDDDSAARSRG